MQIAEFDIHYVLKKSIKGQAITYFLAAHAVPQKSLLNDIEEEDVMEVGILPPWILFFDGAAIKETAGVGIVLISPKGDVLPYSYTLQKLCTGNMAEYESLIIGLQFVEALYIMPNGVRRF